MSAAYDARPRTYLGRELDLTNIDPVALPPINFVLRLLDPSNPPLITNVGYGLDESLNSPGDGGNAGGAQPSRPYGLRFVSDATAALNTMMKDQSMLVGSMNPARGYDGYCNGDSGGPNFFIDESGRNIQVGISSSADAVCRGMAILSRIDIPQAQSFLACAATAANSIAYAACGCTTLNKKGVCEQ